MPAWNILPELPLPRCWWRRRSWRISCSAHWRTWGPRSSDGGGRQTGDIEITCSDLSWSDRCWSRHRSPSQSWVPGSRPRCGWSCSARTPSSSPGSPDWPRCSRTDTAPPSTPTSGPAGGTRTPGDTRAHSRLSRDSGDGTRRLLKGRQAVCLCFTGI